MSGARLGGIAALLFADGVASAQGVTQAGQGKAVDPPGVAGNLYEQVSRALDETWKGEAGRIAKYGLGLAGVGGALSLAAGAAFGSVSKGGLPLISGAIQASGAASPTMTDGGGGGGSSASTTSN